MSAITNTLLPDKGISALIKKRPLTTYFILAYAGMWIVFSPIVLSSMGLFVLPDALSFILFALSSYTGPLLAAYTVTGMVEGRTGVNHLIRRTLQMRAGIQWYAVALFGFLGIWLAGYSILFKGALAISLITNWTLLFLVFLPNVLIGLLIPSLGEETGWRGFALPRLQVLYGPLIATLILGTLHGIWHLPAMLTPVLGPFTISRFVAFILTAIAGTFIYTWVFNNTRGSIWIAMVMHASSNAASSLLGELIPAEAVPVGLTPFSRLSG